MKVLLTGGTGFIGSHTYSKLLTRGYKAFLFKGDVRKMGDWEKNLEKEVDVVIHLAAVRAKTEKDFEGNVKGIENLFMAAQRLNKLPKKVILASSQAVYMGCKKPFKEDTKPKPTTIYGRSKLKAEKVAQKWSKKLEIPLIILRYSTVLGPGVREKSGMSGPLIVWTRAGLAGEPIRVLQDGKQTRDYIHVDDVVAANLLAVKKLPKGIYNVGGGKEVKLIDFAKWVKDVTGKKSEILIVGGKVSPSDPQHLFSDTLKLESFGWRAEKTAREAVCEFVKKQKK